MSTLNKDEIEILEVREQLVEMYKAGFLDAWRMSHKGFNNKNKVHNANMNKSYSVAFCKRFEKRVKEVMKNEEKKK